MTKRDDDRSLARTIAKALAERIVDGRLMPDAPLRQDHVATEFGASHVPVREAFRRLEADGLAVSLPRRGARVAPLDPQTITEVTEMRAALEVLALRFALPRITQTDIARMAQAIADGDASRDIAIWEDANRRFHRAITAPCAMPRLMTTIDGLHRASARFLFATWRDLDWQPRSDLEHRTILTCIERRELGAATAALSAHIRDAGAALVNALRTRSQSP